jgi:hypothetical protein
MAANYVNPFDAFKNFVEFYPKLGAAMAFGTMAAAARMIPTSGAPIIKAPQVASGPQPVTPANNSSTRKKGPSARRKQSSPRKTPRKASKRSMGRRKAA